MTDRQTGRGCNRGESRPMQSLSVRLYLNNTLKVNLSLFSLPLLSFPSSPSFLLPFYVPFVSPISSPSSPSSISPSTPVFSRICSYLCSAACQFALPVHSLSPPVLLDRLGLARLGPLWLQWEQRDRGNEGRKLYSVCVHVESSRSQMRERFYCSSCKETIKDQLCYLNSAQTSL